MSTAPGEPETFEQHWPAPPPVPGLTVNQVHVWRVTLPASPDEIVSIASDLDGDEQARAARFTRPRDRDRYLAWHGLLRRILSRYLDVGPARVNYVFGLNGKPGLAPGLTPGDLRFNLTHAGDMALVAVSRGREVGVDLEQLRRLPEAESIAEQHFSPGERAALAGLSPAELPPAFFKIWTCKEAYIKATGQGLSHPLSLFSVPVLPAGGGAPVPIAAGAGRQWAVCAFTPAAGYAGAVVAEGLHWVLKYWQYS